MQVKDLEAKIAELQSQTQALKQEKEVTASQIGQLRQEAGQEQMKSEAKIDFLQKQQIFVVGFLFHLFSIDLV